MRIDTIKKTVTFTEGEVLDEDGVRALISILDIDQPDLPNPSTVVVAEHLTRSDSDFSKLYRVVRYKDGHFTCECTDFVIRRSKTGDDCKHISRIRFRYF